MCFLLDENPPPIETPVLILYKGEWRIGEQLWDHPGFEDTYRSFLYWDCPYDDGQDWQTEDITHWFPLPPIEKPSCNTSSPA